MKQLVINADDYGRTEVGDRRIRRSVEEGAVTSVSALANIREGFDTDFLYEREVGFGAHLNLTEGEPLTEASTLVDSSGRFLGFKRFLIRYLLRRVDPADIRDELRAQADKLNSSFRGQMDHIDTHQHVHLLPGVRDTVSEVAKENDVRYVRCVRESMPSASYVLKSATLSKIPRMCAAALTRLIVSCTRSRGFAGILNMGCWTDDKMKAFLSANGREKTEICVHPERQSDLEALTDPAVKEMAESKYELTQFSSFFESRTSNSS